MYAILAEAQFSPAETVRNQRLEGARNDLAHADFATWTVAAIGRRWCFPNAAHFGLLLRQQFGMSQAQSRAWTSK